MLWKSPSQIQPVPTTGEERWRGRAKAMERKILRHKYTLPLKIKMDRTALMVQWLGLRFYCGGAGFSP